MSKQRQLSKRVLREQAAEREATAVERDAAIARNRAAAAVRQAEKDAPETLAQLLGAIVLGIILIPVAAWPMALLIWTTQGEQYDVLSDNTIRFRLSAWMFWLLLVLGIGLLSMMYAKLKQARGEIVGMVYAVSALIGALGLVLLTHNDQAQNDLNRMRSDYQYTMRVKIVPSRYAYWADYTTPHVLVPTIGFHSTRYTRALPDPCVDVHLGLLGGHFAGQPYTCGTRADRRMASAEELSPVVPARSGWLW
jgi:uncharacterized Tic20 family protein